MSVAFICNYWSSAFIHDGNSLYIMRDLHKQFKDVYFNSEDFRIRNSFIPRYVYT